MLMAVALARASGDEALHRNVSYGVILTGVLGLVAYALFAPSAYLDAWRQIRILFRMDPDR